MIFEQFLEKSKFNDYQDFIENYKINVPKNFNFAYDVLDVLAEKIPNEIALMWCDENGREKQFTFSEMSKLSNKAANYFISLGIQKGDAVMLVLKRNYEFWVSIMALHKIGAVVVPATHLLTARDYVFRNNAAKVKAIIASCDKWIIANVDLAVGLSPTVETRILANGDFPTWQSMEHKIEEFPDTFERVETDNSDIMLIYFTSGTSGMPKMVAHDFTYPLGHIVTAAYWLNCQKGGLHFTVAETGWGKAVWGKLYGQWLCESTVFVYDMDSFNAKKTLDKMQNYKITSFCAPPTVYRFMLKEDLESYDLSAIKHSSTAGEPLNPCVFEEWQERTGLEIIEGFGQTETTVSVANFPYFEAKPASMGKPSPLYDVHLEKADGTLCKANEHGEIVISEPKERIIGFFCGYLTDGKLKSPFVDGKYRSGDVAYFDEDGYYWFVGREDDVIKTSGYRVGPFEVESAVLAHEAVLEAAITAVPDELRGQVIKATVVLHGGYEASDELADELKKHVKKITAPYKYPRIIEFVDELPKTISGKIRRVEIRENDKKEKQ